MIIRNINDFKKIITNINIQVIDVISEKTLDLLETHIQKDVYEFDYFPNKVYEDGTKNPTYQFKRSFILDNIKSSYNNVSRKLFHDYNLMDAPTTEHPTRHGATLAKNSGIMDLRKELAKGLNINGIYGKKKRNAYWDNFLKDLEKNIFIWIKEEYSKRGINLKRK